MTSYLKLENISFHYKGIGAAQSDVLSNISLNFSRKECVAIVGASGSGKTTLIQHFNGLLKPSSGRVLFQGQDIWDKSFDTRELRQKIGIVFQFPEIQLFEETVEKDIAFGPRNLGLSAKEIDQRVTEAMSAVELGQEFCQRSPFQLSEGEKRRAAIAGVLAMKPEMLVFDEPTAGLDPRGLAHFTKLVMRLLPSRSIIIVTHNMDFVADVADRVVALHQGRVKFDGQPKMLFRDSLLLREIGLEEPTVSKAIATYASMAEELRDVISMRELQQKIKSSRAQSTHV